MSERERDRLARGRVCKTASNRAVTTVTEGMVKETSR